MMLITTIVIAVFAADAAPIDTFFEEFRLKRDAIFTLQAAYTETTTSQDDTFEDKGTLLYLRPRRILRRTAEATILIDDDRGYLYEPEIKQLQIYDIADDPEADVLFLGFDNDTESLRKTYDLSLIERGDDPRGRKGLVLRPKAEAEIGAFLEITLMLREEDYLPYWVEVIHDEESRTVYEVSGFAINQPLDPSESRIALAEGTKIIDNDIVVETVAPGGKLVPDAATLEDATLESVELPPPPAPAAASP